MTTATAVLVALVLWAAQTHSLQSGTISTQGWFTYVELHFDDIVCNVHSADGAAGPVPVPQP